MQFANPIFLWALTGLSIPIGIHLLSRKEGKVIKLGSLRHVHETSTQQFRGIKLNEILLLILRCLLILIFTLIISGLHWSNFGKSRWLLIENGLENQQQLKSIIDSLSQQGYESRLLLEDFPLLEDSSSSPSSVNYGRLIEQVKTKNLSDVIVFAQNKVENFKGLREALPANVRWISQSLEPLDYTLINTQIRGDSVETRQGHTSSEATYFTTEKKKKSSSVPDIKSPDTITITIASEDKYAYDLKIIKAALNSIRKSFAIELIVHEKKPTDFISIFNWCIWLSDKKVPDMDSVKLIFIQPTHDLKLVIQVENNQWYISKRLNEEVALQESLTLNLASLLIPNKELQGYANSKDRRMISDSSAWASIQSDHTISAAGAVSGHANPYLIVLLLVLLFIERTIAYKRNQ